MVKKHLYKIGILADDFAPAADKVISMLEDKTSKALAVKTFLKKNENDGFNAYIDDTAEDSRIGKVESWPEELDLERTINLYEYSIALTDYDDETAIISAEMTVKIDAAIVDEKPSEIPREIKQAIDEKGVPEEVLPAVEERVKYMLNNYVSVRLILAVIKYWDSDLLKAQGNKIPTLYVDPNLETMHKLGKNGMVSKSIQAYLIGSPTILEGPKATGKNTCINTIIWLFGDRMEEHTFTMQDSVSDLMTSEGTDNSASDLLKNIRTDILADAEKIRLAHTASNNSKEYTKEEDEVLMAEALFKQLSAQAASVHIIHEHRAFARWLLDETGHTCFVADEMNMADANLLIGLLHPILDGSITTYDIPGRGLVPLAKHHMLFATMNEGYVGEAESNPATRSRFDAFELGQPKTINGILHSAVRSELKKRGIEGDLEEKYYTQAEKFYDACKKTVEDGGQLSDTCLNVRGVIRAMTKTKIFEGDNTLNECLEASVVTPCSSDERVTLMALLNNIVTI